MALGTGQIGCRPLVVLLMFFLAGCAGSAVDALLNTTYQASDEPTPTPQERWFHQNIFIADLHGDTLMWDRDLLERSDLGHIDLPRLIEGNVALQVFSVPTRTPYGFSNLNGDCFHPDGLNAVRLLHAMQSDQLQGWGSTLQEANRQADKLHAAITQSQADNKRDPDLPYLMLIRSAHDLNQLIERRFIYREPVVGALLAVEGVHWLGAAGMTDVEIEAGVETLYSKDFRMLAATHRFHNDLGLSSEGCSIPRSIDNPEARRIFYRAAQERGMVIDLAHSGTITNDLEGGMIQGPFVVSHGGFEEHLCRREPGACESERNLGNEEIGLIVRNGGVIGVGFWPQAVGKDYAGIVGAFNHACGVIAGLESDSEIDPSAHLAFGSDFDGSVSTPFDAGGYVHLVAALMRNRPDEFPDPASTLPNDPTTLRRVAGHNACLVLAAALGASGSLSADSICAPLLAGD